MSILERLSALLAPDNCLGCGREGALVCSACSQGCFIDVERCFQCLEQCGSAVCSPCLQMLPFTSLQAACDYQGVGKRLVAQLKFAHNQSAARLMAQTLHRRCSLPRTGLLVYMPATNDHVRERGFDQSQLIIRELSRLTGLPWATVLRRDGSRHQLGSSREQRHQQLGGALHITRSQRVHNQCIVLVDDVITTGSSLLAAANVLLKAGSKDVHCIAFAQANLASTNRIGREIRLDNRRS